MTTPSTSAQGPVADALARTERRENGLRANMDEIATLAHQMVSIVRRGALRPDPKTGWLESSSPSGVREAGPYLEAAEPVALPEDRELPTVTERGLAGQIMDAAWPHYGGNHQTAEFWNDFDEGVRFALHYAHPAPATVESVRALPYLIHLARQRWDGNWSYTLEELAERWMAGQFHNDAAESDAKAAALAPATEGRKS